MKCLAKLAQEKSGLLSHNIIDYFFKNHEKVQIVCYFQKILLFKIFEKQKQLWSNFLCPQILREKEKKLLLC
jgi:hypothetical protein